MSKLSPMDELAQQVCDSAKDLSQYLRSENYPQPSFERDAPTTTLPKDASQDILATRQKLVEASLKIFQLATGPSEFLPNLQIGYQTLFALRWLIHFKIFAYIPLHNSITYTQLASLANVSPTRLKSICRMAMLSSILHESSSNTVAHTATSALFITQPSYLDWATFMFDASVPTAGKLVEATEKWPESVKKNETAYNVAFGTEKPFFEHLKEEQERARVFGSYMRSVTDSEGTKLEHLVNGYDWASLGDATVVDVGGSTGHCSIALAKTFPKLNFLVQDLPEAVAHADLTKETSRIQQQIAFVPHDFFQDQYIKAADVYLLRMILHDWPAKEAATILRHLVDAMGPKSKIILMDTVLPAPGEVSMYKESLLRVRDLTMMQVFNSSERSMEDWTELFENVDRRLKVKNLVQPQGSNMSVMELVLKDAGMENKA